uniref:Uncharacterized protein n=1 Tax=Romanomermis culicivorax TaxID=13658 RepID=A0A915HEV4_ROMCU
MPCYTLSDSVGRYPANQLTCAITSSSGSGSGSAQSTSTGQPHMVTWPGINLRRATVAAL